MRVDVRAACIPVQLTRLNKERLEQQCAYRRIQLCAVLYERLRRNRWRNRRNRNRRYVRIRVCVRVRGVR